ncbi:MAG: DUF4132 domain-containing protein [Polyangiaceae bacterium]
MPTPTLMLSVSLATTCAPKAAKTKSWLDAPSLPPVRTSKGDLLGASEVETLLGVLEKGSAAKVGAALSALDAADADAFGIALGHAWIRGRGPADQVWALRAAARLAGPKGLRALALWVRKFGREKAVPAALVIVDALGELESDAALIELRKLENAPKEVAAIAEKHAKRIRRRRGLDGEDLEDLIVPDCSLGAGEALDFGPRTFRVDFDSDFTPVVRDEAGKRLANLPRPGKKDDAEKAAAAVERWADLKTLLRDTLRNETKRLEWAMCAKRRWSAARFSAAIVGHPLLCRLAQRLLWATCDEEGRAQSFQPFRVAEDRTFADSADEPLALDGSAFVLIPHALDLGPEACAKWSTIFADYAVLPPFPQLGRETYTPMDNERGSTVLERFRQHAVADKARFAIENYGWDDADEYGTLSFTRVFPDGTEATASLGSRWDAIPIRTLTVHADKKLGAMDPLSFSELCRDIAKLPLP